MLARLDAETRSRHANVDRYWLDLMTAGVSRTYYKTLLEKLYGIEAPLESALAYTPQLVIADRRERMRSGLIAQDLLALGLPPARITALPQCAQIEPFDDPAVALGWKYVVERPTQLHGALKRNLVARVADVAHAVAYLSACDGIAAARWQQLGALLDEVAARPGADASIIRGAKAAFDCVRDWLAR